MKKLIFIGLLMMLAGELSSAFGNWRNLPAEAKERVKEILKAQNPIPLSDNLTVCNSHTSSTNEARQAEADDIQLTANLIWDETSDFSPIMAVLQSQESTAKFTVPYMGDSSLILPAKQGGKYYVAALFKSWAGAVAVVAKEWIADTDSEMTFNMDEATNQIQFLPLMPDGTELTTPAYLYDDQGEATLIDEGTVNSAHYSLQVGFKEGVGIAAINSNFLRFGITEDIIYDVTKDACCAYVNDNDCLYVFEIVEAFDEKHGGLVVKMIADGCESQTVSNSPQDYVSVHREFGESLWDVPTEDEPFPGLIENPSAVATIPNTHNWETSRSGGTSSSSLVGNGAELYDTSTLWMCASEPQGNDRLTVCVAPANAFYNSFANKRNYGIYSPQVTLIDGKLVNIVNHELSNFCFNVFDQYFGNEPGNYELKNNPWFSFPYKENDYPLIGGNVPVTTFVKAISGNAFYYNFIGRYSELRSIDLMNHKLNLFYNDDLICDNYSGLQDLFMGWYDNPLPAGKFRVEIEDANLTVDGLQGKNETVVSYDSAQEDAYPPILQILQFRDMNGEVTDKFDKPEDGIITFAGGDFHYNMTDDYFYWCSFSYASEINVEYSPYTAGDYSPLAIEEDKDKFYMPGYGAYYWGKLSQVDRESETGWFDVRISMADEAGNSMTQTISPAFKIQSLATGVLSPMQATDGISVEGNNIIAPDNAEVYSINGVKVGKTGLSKGIYVVCIGSQREKVIIK